MSRHTPSALRFTLTSHALLLCGSFPVTWMQAPGSSTIRMAANRTDRLCMGASTKRTPDATTQPLTINIGHRTRHVIGPYGITPTYLGLAMFCGGAGTTERAQRPDCYRKPADVAAGHPNRHQAPSAAVPRVIFSLVSSCLAAYRTPRAFDARAPETVTASWTATPALAPWLNGCPSFFPPTASWVSSRRSTRSASVFRVRPFVARRYQCPSRTIERHFHLTG